MPAPQPLPRHALGSPACRNGARRRAGHVAVRPVQPRSERLRPSRCAAAELRYNTCRKPIQVRRTVIRTASTARRGWHRYPARSAHPPRRQPVAASPARAGGERRARGSATTKRPRLEGGGAV